jgi:hypothetical protein
MDEEARRLDIELLADVLADLDQVLAALAAGARLRLMAMLDAWQVLGQRLPTRARTLWSCPRLMDAITVTP